MLYYLSTQECSQYRGVEQLEARRAHNPEVVGSSPASATIKTTVFKGKTVVFLCKKFGLSNPKINPIGPWGLFGVYGDFGRSGKGKLRTFLNIFISRNFFCFLATFCTVDGFSFAFYNKGERGNTYEKAKALCIFERTGNPCTSEKPDPIQKCPCPAGQIYRCC